MLLVIATPEKNYWSWQLIRHLRINSMYVYTFSFAGMFIYDKQAGVHWFSARPCDNYQEFNLVGVVSLNI